MGSLNCSSRARLFLLKGKSSVCVVKSVTVLEVYFANAEEENGDAVIYGNHQIGTVIHGDEAKDLFKAGMIRIPIWPKKPRISCSDV